MVALSTALLIASAVSATVGTVVSLDRAKDAQGEQEEAQEKAEARDEKRRLVARRKSVREQRIRAANVKNSAASSGAAGSSSEVSAVGTLGADLATNLAVSRQEGQAQRSINADLNAAADDIFQGNVASGLGSLTSNIFLQGANIEASK
jgi:hypothetical protein